MSKGMWCITRWKGTLGNILQKKKTIYQLIKDFTEEYIKYKIIQKFKKINKSMYSPDDALIKQNILRAYSYLIC